MIIRSPLCKWDNPFQFELNFAQSKEDAVLNPLKLALLEVYRHCFEGCLPPVKVTAGDCAYSHMLTLACKQGNAIQCTKAKVQATQPRAILSGQV